MNRQERRERRRGRRRSVGEGGKGRGERDRGVESQGRDMGEEHARDDGKRLR